MKVYWKIKHVLFEAKKSTSYLLNAVFSTAFGEEKCLICSNPVCGKPLCPQCSKELKNLACMQNERCCICGRSLVSEEKICNQCRTEPLLKHCDSCSPLFSYRLWNKSILFDWKMCNERSLSPYFSSLLFSALTRKFPVNSSIPVIVPVPPRKGKIHSKGWDQIQELCEYLKWRYGLKIFSCLERVSTVQQKKLDRKERLDTVGKNFILGKEFYKAEKKGKLPESVILLDDIITTGATVESCAGLLKKSGILNVHVVSIFIVD